MCLNPARREEVLNRLARRIAELGMTAPAILFFESFKPLAFLGAQLLWVAQPLLSFGFNAADYNDFTLIVQEPDGVEALLAHLEANQRPNPN